jgi:hypothetical protein
MSTDKKDPFDVFLESYCKELMDMSDADVLQGATPGESKAIGTTLLREAKARAGRARFAAAKAGLAARRAQENSTGDAEVVSAAAAKAYLRNATNDARYTLAARKLDEMSDEDVLRFYQQCRRLERESEDPDKGKT